MNAARSVFLLFIVVFSAVLYQRSDAFTAGAGNIGNLMKRDYRHDMVTKKLHFNLVTEY